MKVVFEFIKNKKSLNLKGDSYFPGICKGSDLHVSDLPDKTNKCRFKNRTGKKAKVVKGRLV